MDQEVLFSNAIIEPLGNFLLLKGAKSPRKKVSFSANFALLAGFYQYRCYNLHRSRDALSPVCVIFLLHPSQQLINSKSIFSHNLK